MTFETFDAIILFRKIVNIKTQSAASYKLYWKDAMSNIKEYLRSVGISKQELASEIKLSRPTLDAYIAAYERGEEIPRERYQIIFDQLFGVKLDEEAFRGRLSRFKILLDRDERLGTEKIDPKAADVISRLKGRMLQDMSRGDWNQAVYSFIDMLITNYRGNEIFEKLAEYFTYLNRSKMDDVAREDQIPYFARYYKTFSSLLDDPYSFETADFEAFMKRREQIIRDKVKEDKQQELKLKKIINETAKELEKTGVKATEEEILRAVLDKVKK